MIQTIAEITQKQQIQKNIFAFNLKTPQIAKTAQPGQFVHVLANGCTLRRPFSICEVVVMRKLKLCFK